MSFIISLFALVAVNACIVNADIYMHNLRGSNNRLDETTGNRRTNNRLFDSQNNNKGGYNVGDRTDQPAKNAGSTEKKYKSQYRMKYFGSGKGAGESKVNIEWTMQHGCGGNEDTDPHKLNCNAVLQYMCQPDLEYSTTMSQDEINKQMRSEMRDGVTTSRNDYRSPRNRETSRQFEDRVRNSNRVERGMQEPYQWYDKCFMRDRNTGLFIADQKVKGKSSRHTRQNPNGNRNGYECPEERDYYPYWHPTDWKDAAVFAENSSMCSYYEKESFNVQSRGECVEKFHNEDKPKHYSKYNNKKSCEDKGGEWLEFHNFLEKAKQFTKATCPTKDKKYIWARPIYGYKEECLVALEKPVCSEAPWSRVNHLGNTRGDAETANFVWKIPNFPSKTAQRCVFRIRYNISTDDYDPYKTDSKSNGNSSPITNDPEVDIGAQDVKFQLAINTAQTGRTFEDRSHVYKIYPRPDDFQESNIYNINVRGKRGNIVQCYPAVEYDFSPTNLKMKENDLIHIQWTGSNTHNNNNPAGDGQAGDDGEGRGGTDRSNIIPMGDRNHNYPILAENVTSLFNNVKVHWAPGYTSDREAAYTGKLTADDIYLQYASAGYYQCATCDHAHSLEKKDDMDVLLNNAPASYEGMVLQFTKKGTYHYMCSRNNNFSNRSQKGTIKVE